MPEGPECRVTAEQVNSLLQGKTLTHLECSYDKALSGTENLDLPLLYSGYKVHGKKMVFFFGTYGLMSKLSMTGRWSVTKSPYTRAILHFDDYSLYFDDARKFGSNRIGTKEEAMNWLSIEGPDLLAAALSDPGSVEKSKLTDLWCKAIRKSPRRSICSWLLDQKIFAGIGNYVKSDLLYLASISPYRYLGELTEEDQLILLEAALTVLEDSYRVGGFTMSDYQHPDGKAGGYKPLIYGREEVDGQKVKYDKISQRGTYWIQQS